MDTANSSYFFNRSGIDSTVFYFGDPIYIEHPEQDEAPEGSTGPLIFNLQPSPNALGDEIKLTSFKYHTTTSDNLALRFQRPGVRIKEKHQICTSRLARSFGDMPSKTICGGTHETGHEEDCLEPIDESLVITMGGIYKLFIETTKMSRSQVLNEFVHAWKEKTITVYNIDALFGSSLAQIQDIQGLYTGTGPEGVEIVVDCQTAGHYFVLATLKCWFIFVPAWLSLSFCHLRCN